MDEFMHYFVGGLGYAAGSVVPAVIVVLIVAIFARRLWAFLFAGMLPPLALLAQALILRWRFGLVPNLYVDDPAQQVYDVVISLISGAVIGYAAYVIKMRRRVSS